MKHFLTELARNFLSLLFKLLYKIEIHGLENYPQDAEKLMIVCNHVSYIDAPILAVYLPHKIMFAISPVMAELWWVKPWLNLVEALPLDTTKPMATKKLIHMVKDGHHTIIFPEGRLTETGTLMKVYEGTSMIADRAKALVLPVHLQGVENTLFSRLTGRVKQGLFGKIIMTIGKPQYLELDEAIRGRQRRHLAAQKLYDVMSNAMFNARKRPLNLFDGLIHAAKSHGAKRNIIEDTDRNPISYQRVCLGSIILGDKIAKISEKKETLGVLLPNVIGNVVTFFALHAYERIPAMLNFSAGAINIISACHTAKITKVLTSYKFVERGKLESIIEALEKENIVLVYLEDIRKKVGLLDKLSGMMKLHFYNLGLCKTNTQPHDPAVVLFTSGSEGTPKGVLLSHDNILANCSQAFSRIDFNHKDKVFNALPMFHSFGLTAGTILPLMYGAELFLYPSPLHYRIVPEMIYTMNATIFFTTDTFLNGYARVSHPYDFYSVRYIVAGAEKVREETRKHWMNKYGIRILEGYGATETAPVLTINTPIHFKEGTAGRLLPEIEYKLTKVEGIEKGGRLQVKGPNVMLGYYKADKPGVLQPPEQGWYDTGDIADVDKEGFVAILGRAKRFAKVAGEMVSLTAVENFILKIYPNKIHAIMAVPDPRKGEQLVLITNEKEATRQAIKQTAREYHFPELFLPKYLLIKKEIPLLGSGKVDYMQLKGIVQQEIQVSYDEEGDEEVDI